MEQFHVEQSNRTSYNKHTTTDFYFLFLQFLLPVLPFNSNFVVGQDARDQRPLLAFDQDGPHYTVDSLLMYRLGRRG